MLCVHDFLRREVLVKVGVMEFGLKPTISVCIFYHFTAEVLVVSE